VFEEDLLPLGKIVNAVFAGCHKEDKHKVSF
jgi:hypothetical protein